jgi:predicted ATPase
MARLPYFIGVLAEALARHGRLSEADERIREALDLVAVQNEKWCAPELLRIQAFIALNHGQHDTAERLLIESRAMAEEIGAWSWSLRTSTDLARLWQAQSRYEDARRMLQPVYNRFTEGFETRDLVSASQILHALQRHI